MEYASVVVTHQEFGEGRIGENTPPVLAPGRGELDPRRPTVVRGIEVLTVRRRGDLGEVIRGSECSPVLRASCCECRPRRATVCGQVDVVPSCDNTQSSEVMGGGGAQPGACSAW